MIFFKDNKNLFLRKCVSIRDFNIWQEYSFSFGEWGIKLHLTDFEKGYYLDNHDLYIIYNRNSITFEDSIIGVFSIFNCNSYFYLWNLGIRKQFRRQGYGSFIMKYILNHYNDIIFTINKEQNIPFYTKVLKENRKELKKLNTFVDRYGFEWSTDTLYTTHSEDFSYEQISEIVKEASDNISNCVGLFND